MFCDIADSSSVQATSSSSSAVVDVAFIVVVFVPGILSIFVMRKAERYLPVGERLLTKDGLCSVAARIVRSQQTNERNARGDIRSYVFSESVLDNVF